MRLGQRPTPHFQISLASCASALNGAYRLPGLCRPTWGPWPVPTQHLLRPLSRCANSPAFLHLLGLAAVGRLHQTGHSCGMVPAPLHAPLPHRRGPTGHSGQDQRLCERGRGEAAPRHPLHKWPPREPMAETDSTHSPSPARLALGCQRPQRVRRGGIWPCCRVP